MALDNGVSVRPPLGWSSRGAVNETVVRAQADAMVARGLVRAGYRYLLVADMWAEPERGADGRLVPSRARFPSGMRALAGYLGERNLSLGLGTDVGVRTCGGQPGSFGSECTDAATLVAWGVEWVREDHCAPPPWTNGTTLDGFLNAALGRMRDCLNATGSRVHFDVSAHSCHDPGTRHDPRCWGGWYRNASRLANSWRTTADIGGGWASVARNLYRNNQFGLALNLSSFAGPQHWNDPDSLVVGMGELTPEQEKTQFAMWAMMASPLIAGNRLDRMSADTAALLTHGPILALNQDPLGFQAIRIQVSGAAIRFHDGQGDPLVRFEQEVWAKPLLLYPGQLIQFGFALALLNHARANATVTADTTILASALPHFLPSTSAPKFDAVELWTGQHVGDVVVGDTVAWNVPPDGVAVVRLDPACLLLSSDIGAYN